jgi:hypothetical protein
MSCRRAGKLLIVLMTLTCGGCIESIPTDAAYIGQHEIRQTPNGVEFKSEIKMNATTAEEVRSFFGKPLWEFHEGRTDVYQARARHHLILNVWPVVIARPPESYLVRFDYDNRGVLQHVDSIPGGIAPDGALPRDLTAMWRDLK